MSEFINTVDVVGDELLTNSIIDRTVSEYKDDAVSNIGHSAFAACNSLVNVDLPNVTSIANNAFGYNPKIANVNLPNMTSMGVSAFSNCSSLASMVLPNVTKISDSAFYTCTKLESVDAGKATSIGNSAFYYCSKLKVLILRCNQVCSLVAPSAFGSSSFYPGGTGGTVYVPQALISEYQNASNWSSLYASGDCNFVALEGSEYE
jgi:hypothetical protein